MNMKVIFQNNKEGLIDPCMLDQMISANRIKMFMRSDGWAMVGISPMRGSGGIYDGLERRTSYSFTEWPSYKIVA